MPKTVGLIPMKTRIAEIQSIYENTAERIIALLSSLDPATYTAAESGKVLSDIKLIIAGLDVNVRIWAPRAIRAAYEESAAFARTRLELIGAEQLPPWKYNPIRHDKKIAALAKTAMRDLFKANRTIERTARQYISAMMQAAAGVEKVKAQTQEFDAATVKDFIKRTVAGSLRATTQYNAGMAHLTSKDIAAKIRMKLLGKIKGGDFIKIKGKDGITRNYNLKSYSELVARTRMRESQTEAVKESMKQFDEDLVEIPRHDNPCEICAPYQDQVYSISGRTPGYPLLPDGGPPWH